MTKELPKFEINDNDKKPDMDLAKRILEEYSKKSPEIKEELETHSKTKYKRKNKKLRQYLVPNILGFLAFVIVIGQLLFKVPFFWILITILLLTPLVLVTFVINIYLINRDKRLITNYITKKVNRNYIVAQFFGENKTIVDEIRVMNNDGKSFEYSKGVYMIDKEAVFFNERKEPVLFYLKGLPNPLKFNFSKYIQEYILKVETMAKDSSSKSSFPLDWEGRIIDVSYSSENLQLYKNDKVFKEIHSDTVNKYMKLIIGFMVLLGISFMVIIVMAIIK